VSWAGLLELAEPSVPSTLQARLEETRVPRSAKLVAVIQRGWEREERAQAGLGASGRAWVWD